MIVTASENRGRRLLAGFGLPAALFVLSLPAAVAAENAGTVSPQALRAKLDYCEVCHGVSAQGFIGFYPIPRLAGQPVEYIENELKGFTERKRANAASPTATNVMFNVGHALSPAMIKALAESLNKLNPRPIGGGPKENLAAGKKIFDDGIASANVPACASCHGAKGEGNGPMPRLAGQLYSYVVRQLANWSHERQEENSDVMAPIAHGLTESQIDAVAAYVSDLE